MTVKLYDSDAYIKEFYAVVTECEAFGDKWSVVLDKTAFFPEGGGQLSDKGSIDNASVEDVQIKNGVIYHTTDKPLPVGNTVQGVIDFKRRFDFMQQHSGEHIVSGIANKIFGCENVGFHLGTDITTIDFDRMLTYDEVLRLQREANSKVFENAIIKTYYPDEETLKNLEYRSKKEILEDIRIVEIENTDVCACCAPHVKSAGEIGFIALEIAEKVRGGIRLELKCGKRALEDFEIKQKNIRQIATALCLRQEETYAGVERLIKQISELKFKLTGFKKQLIEQKLSAYAPKERITAIFESDMDMKEMQSYADALYKKAEGIRGVLCPADKGFSFVFCGEAQEIDEFFVEFRGKFNVRGGGRNGMVQGTVFAEQSEIVDFIDNKN